MAKYRIGADLEFETITPGELADGLSKHDAQRERQMMADIRAIKPRRLPPMSGLVAGGAVVIGGDSGGVPVGPASGYCWFLRLIAVTGLVGGATPDLLNMQIFGGGTGVNWWQFGGGPAGVPYFSKWGMGELWLNAGEYLGFTNQGALAAVGTIQVRGSITQIPAEMVGRLFAR